MRLHTINLYRIRHSAIILRWACRALAALVLILTGYGAWWSMTNYLDADTRVAEARRNEQEALALLSGKVKEIDRIGKYAWVVRYEQKKELVEVLDATKQTKGE